MVVGDGRQVWVVVSGVGGGARVSSSSQLGMAGEVYCLHRGLNRIE